MVHVGIDLHKHVSQVARLDESGELNQTRLDNDREQIKRYFRAIPTPAKVAIEASGTWWWIVDLLEELGHQPVLSNPKQTKAIAAARLKNDRVDAERLAVLLRGDLLPTVWIPPAEIREARELLRHRIQLVWTRTAIKNQILALLARRNIRPQASSRWTTVGGRNEIQALELGSNPGVIRDNCLQLMREIDQRVRELDKELARQWAGDPIVKRLVTIPGVGVLIATILLLEIGNISRFPSAKHLASYIGLTPRIRASANRIRTGRISKEGNRLLRWALVIAATQAARKPGTLRTWYRNIQQRRGKKIARVALARKLVEIVYHVWIHEVEFLTVLNWSVRG
jgi:transposase